MSERYEFGIQVDERLQLEHYKASSKAFKVMVILGVVEALIALLVLRQDMIALALASVFMAGLIVHDHYVNKAGWEEYVQEQVANDEHVRRRALRSIFKRGCLLFIFGFLNERIVFEGSIPKSIMYGLIFGVSVSITYWWYEVYVVMRRKKKRELEGEPSGS